jgi:RimJ/RimL family protein N-acetyltransferase
MTFDAQPFLASPPVYVRPLQESDFDDLYAVAVDPLLWEQHPDRDRSREDVFRRYFEAAVESGGAVVFISTDTRSIIGASRYHGYDEERSEVEIGWTFLARSHWGGQYNGEIKRLMLDHAFKSVQSVIFRVDSENFRSQRSVEKLGGVVDGTVTEPDGRESIVYRVAARDWTNASA